MIAEAFERKDKNLDKTSSQSLKRLVYVPRKPWACTCKFLSSRVEVYCVIDFAFKHILNESSSVTTCKNACLCELNVLVAPLSFSTFS